MRSILTLLVFVMTNLSASVVGATPIKIALVGDSTVMNYTAPSTLVGWGQVLGGQFTAGSVSITNYAVGGESSKSFLNEGRWNPVLAAKPAYVFIQFGHNDNATSDFAKPQAYRTFAAAPPTSITAPLTARDYYRNNLTTYIATARDAGIVPIVVLPMERRVFDASGHIKPFNEPYADAAREVATSLNVAVIDLHVLSIATYESLGESASTYLSAEGGTDRSHFSTAGANLYAQGIASALREANHPLAAVLVPEPIAVAPSALSLALLALRRRRAARSDSTEVVA